MVSRAHAQPYLLTGRHGTGWDGLSVEGVYLAPMGMVGI